MLRWLWSLVPQPQIDSHLLVDEGEVVVDEVPHHWVVYVLPALEAFAALLLVVGAVIGPIELGWLLLLFALALTLMAVWQSLTQHLDRFVITNMRVFRVHGVLTSTRATMPIARILDITLRKPLTGRILGYGHFVFESAAQEQGVKDIRFVGRPDERELTIQRVIQRSGLRGPRAPMP